MRGRMILSTITRSSRVGRSSLILSVVLFLMMAGGQLSRGWAQGPDATQSLSLNVRNMPVGEVLKLIAGEADLDLAIGSGVSGQVTLFVEDLAVDELLGLVVDLVGAAYSEEHGVIRVMSPGDYERLYGKAWGDGRQRELITLEHVAVQRVGPPLNAVKSSSGQIIPEAETNSVLLIDLPARLEAMKAVLRQLDRPKQTRAYPLRLMTPEAAAERLRGYLLPLAKIEADPVHGRIFVTATPEVLERVESLLGQMDLAIGVRGRVFPLHYAEIEAAQAAIEPDLTPDVGRIWANARTRTLHVWDRPEVLETMEHQIAEVDRPLRQVLIEARIIQVQFDDKRDVGIDWSVVQDDLNVSARFPVLSEGSDGIVVEGGDLQSKDYEYLLEALETVGTTDLLSSPRIMVADSKSAQIHVGSQVPYKTVNTRENAAGGIDRFEQVTIVNVGVKLDVNVKINGPDTVSMDVVPEVSSVTGFSDGIPVVETSTANSHLLIPDRTTVILGGLNRDEQREERSGIPILGSIPLLGYLFSSSSTQTLRTELVILLTPHILDGAEDIRRVQGELGTLRGPRSGERRSITDGDFR